MKTKKLTPRNSAPVQRENTATALLVMAMRSPLSSSAVLLVAASPQSRSTLCGRRRRVVSLFEHRTSNHVKSLFLLASDGVRFASMN
jgi:hypothetical protein